MDRLADARRAAPAALTGHLPTPSMRRLAALIALAALPTLAGCASLFVSPRDRAIDACRVAAQDRGWSLRSVENVRREGTAQRVQMRAFRTIFGTQTLVCYYDPSTGEATIS